MEKKEKEEGLGHAICGSVAHKARKGLGKRRKSSSSTSYSRPQLYNQLLCSISTIKKLIFLL